MLIHYLICYFNDFTYSLLLVSHKWSSRSGRCLKNIPFRCGKCNGDFGIIWRIHYQPHLNRSVLNTLRSILVDVEVLDIDDILHRIRDFVGRDEVYRFAAAKVLLTLIERYVC
jgi:hypothetical protein